MKAFISTLCLIALISSCSTVPLTGRKQLNLVSDQEVLSLSNQAYKEYLSTAKLSTNREETAMVVRVGTNIANAVEKYLRDNGKSDEIQEYSWEFHLVQDPTANAFCLPGGKIVVNEGILPYTQTEAGLAIVLGHEVAHAVAKHSSEKLSRQLLLNAGGSALGVALGGHSTATQQIAQQVYGLGSTVGVELPYSRSNESEADHLGLIFSAMAGYDPNVAVTFWERMAQSGQNGRQLLSTHPSDAARIANIKKYIPEAMKYYNKSGNTNSSPGVREFRIGK